MDLFSLSSLWLEHMVNPPTVGTPGIKKSTLMERKKSFICGKNISQLSVLADFPDCPWTAKIGFLWNGKLWMQINLLQPNISIQVLHTYLYTFPDILTRRICFTINSFFSLWPWCLILGWHCREEINAYHSEKRIKNPLKHPSWDNTPKNFISFLFLVIVYFWTEIQKLIIITGRNFSFLKLQV